VSITAQVIVDRMRALVMPILLFAFPLSTALAQSPPFDDPEFAFGSQTIDGTWRRDVIGKFFAVKHFFDGRYLVFQYSPETNIITWDAFGVFRQDGSVLREKVKFCSSEDLLNQKFSWSLGFTGAGVYSQSSSGYKEVWSRLSGESNSSTLEGVNDFSSKKTELDGVWYRSWSADKTCIKLFDKGRAYCFAFTNDKKVIQFFAAGVFAMDSSGVLREKYIYTTENHKRYKNALLLSDATLAADQKSFEQEDSNGVKEKWARWGNPNN